MSLLVTSLLVASGVMAGRWIAQRTRDAGAGTAGGKPPPNASDGDDDDGKAKAKVAGDDGAPAGDGGKKKTRDAGSAADPFATFPCRLGDVIIGLAGDEAWLAGALVLYEEAPVLALFIAPDAGGDRAVLARTRPADDLLWLKPIAGGGTLDVGREPPSSLEQDGERFERVRRLPVRVERHGAGAPDVGVQAIFAEYKCLAGARLVVVAGEDGAARAWSGPALEAGTYDVLASGSSTL